MPPTKEQVNGVLNAVAQRSPSVADHLERNKGYWTKYIKTTWDARTAAPREVVTLRGRPPTTLSSMFSNVQALRNAVRRGVLPVDAALHKRLDKLVDVTWGMLNEDPAKATQITNMIAEIRLMSSGTQRRSKPLIPAEVAGAPSDVSRVFDLAIQMGA